MSGARELKVRNAQVYLLCRRARFALQCSAQTIFILTLAMSAEEGRVYSTELFDLITRGKLNIHISKHFPFTAEGVQQSQLDLLSGKSTGKLVIDISRD